MQGTLDEIKQSLLDINDATNNISADLERLAGVIAGGLTAAEANGVAAQLREAADKLKLVAAVNPEPPAELPIEPV